MKSNNLHTLLTTPQVCNKLGISNSTLRRYIVNGLLPKGIKFNAQSNVWFEHEIDQFITARINGNDLTTLKELAKTLSNKRPTILTQNLGKALYGA